MNISQSNFSRGLRIVLSMALLLSSLVSNSIHARDLKTYPAFMCLENGKETGDFNRSMYRITRISGNGTGVLLCPIIRDSVDSISNEAHDGVFAIVNTYRTQPGPPVRLTLRKFSAQGELMKEITKYPLGLHQETHLKLKFKKDYGYYMLEISMGVNKQNEYAKVFSYMVVE